MRVGGYANSCGITFYNKVFKVSSCLKNGVVLDDIKWIFPTKWFVKLERVPFLGGLVVLYYQWKIFSTRTKFIYTFLILLMILDEIMKFAYIIPNYYNYLFGITALGIILNLKIIMRIFRFHGAEHKVINCYSEHGYINYELVKKASRFNKRCGSNLVLIFLLLYLIMCAIGHDSLIAILFIMLLSIQIMKVINKKDTSFDKYINLLQYITVQEPKDEEIYLATNAFNKLIKATYIYEVECYRKDNKDKLSTI
ncbi:DUF1385 domain-containing protein [Serpentinicella alkaliphila]|uniref:Uncharacterized protein DUF1385 n=1 Tax=Serpentinicella alkaliphila TaxID=1734049 RepID=A0A4R2TTB8_9FIRM|nr:DUF1385 domain-containing protein [Serpentinicella alkaliphila]QUH24551.1 DUF1385 domain-containing protein [Serpentinicella alkaliphila]TCQ04645.1 uncharacterized protein DUF1385 [Serpentinicella alkaliphila]